MFPRKLRFDYWLNKVEINANLGFWLQDTCFINLFRLARQSFMFSSVMISHTIIIRRLVTVAAFGMVAISSQSSSPCVMDMDTAYDGVRMNCQHLNITSLPLPEKWIPPSITTLLLDYNSISHLNNESFTTLAKHSSLLYISLSHNLIGTIDPFTFSTLTHLQKLDLSSNKINLDRTNLKAEVFQGLSGLLELRLDDNKNKGNEGQYADDLFRPLKKLSILSLETFMGELDFGMLFNNSTELSSLTLTGGMEIIPNNAFESLAQIKLRVLQLSEVDYLYKTEPKAFSYLKYLDIFRITGSHQNLSLTMDSLAPFVNRNMSVLELSSLTRNIGVSEVFRDNTILTRHMARHLSKICLKTVVLTGDDIFVIEVGALTSPTWRRCLRSLDISSNPLTGEVLELFRLSTLTNLKYFRLAGRKYSWASLKNKYTLWQPPACMDIVENPSQPTKLDFKNDISNNGFNMNRHNRNGKRILSHGFINSSTSSQIIQTCDEREFHHCTHWLQSPIVYLPKKLKILVFQSLSDHMMRMNRNYQIYNGEALEEIYLADNGISKFIGSYKGLTNLKIADISNNDGSSFSERFFDTMPTIEHLNMANMKLDTDFMALSSDRLFSVMTNLITLDLSNNELHYLSTNTFLANEKLSVLSLSGNRFQYIPIDLSHVPNLCALDLRRNSFRTITGREMFSLEKQARMIEKFTLRLDENEFFCGCGSLIFLSWLQRSQINFDKNRNYSCMSDSGIRTSTGQMRDLEAMWRVCHGENAFSISIILSCLLVLGFICAIVIPQFKTQLKVFVLKTIWDPFLMKTANDYPIGVYIGYADQDTMLACQRLRPYIERQLRLSTYVRHRDLLPASDLAESIMEAVHSSWRVLLLVSKYFINDPWSYFLLKASTYAVQTDNPGRLVLLLVDDGNQSVSILSKLPRCVVQAVPEENIIKISSCGNISYDDKQAFKTALVYDGGAS